jgi:hypothetical protein
MFLVRNVISQSQSSPRVLSFSTAIAMYLGVATRFDFIVVCIVAIIGLTTLGEDRKIRIFFTYTAVSVGSLLLVVVVQKMYWGSWLPNTYHLKMDGVPALERIGRGIASSMKMLGIGIVVVSALLLSLRVKAIAQRIVLLCGSMFLAVSAYAIYIGGDAWEDQMVNRFFGTVLPLLPAIVVLGFSFPRCKTHLKLILPLLVVASIGYGAGVNPFGINVKYSLGALLATAIGTIFVAALTQLKLRNFHILPSVAILLTVIAPISGIPFQRHIKSNDILGVKTNLYVTEIVENLVPAVSSTAIIATVWAGVPAYYTNRPMIDLLGKNDELIAHSSPKGEFFPGHNKWNYDHSIGRLRPDVIFQTYTRGLENNLAEKIRSWGYEKFCRPVEPFPIDGIYFKVGSKNVKWNELSQCSVP